MALKCKHCKEEIYLHVVSPTKIYWHTKTLRAQCKLEAEPFKLERVTHEERAVCPADSRSTKGIDNCV